MKFQVKILVPEKEVYYTGERKMEEEKVISTIDSLTPSDTVHEISDKVMTGKADYSKTKMFTLKSCKL